MLKTYYHLTKPGIVYGNLLTTIAAYVYASRWQVNVENFFATVFGIALVIASACVFNNYFDRDIDAKMARTKERALVSGAISNASALLFGSILGLAGFSLLVGFVNMLTAGIALIGFLVYVFAYTFSKRKTQWATEIGSIAGATPIVVGYVAATNRLDAAALILFFILVLWQMPHFYSIAIFRAREYEAAGIPVLPLKKGIPAAKRRMLAYIAAFVVATAALTAYGHAGYTYLFVMMVAGALWLSQAAQGFTAADDEKWARRLFFFSLAVLLVFSTVLALAPILP